MQRPFRKKGIPDCIWLFILVAWLAGCGVKTPLIPPDMDLPKAVSGFEAFVRGEEVLFTWTAPDEKQRAEIAGYKAFFEDADNPDKLRCNCRMFRDLAWVDAGRADAEWIKDGRVELRLPVMEEHLGKTFHYVVVPVSRKGFAGPESHKITIHWIRPPLQPLATRTEPADRSVLISWDAPGDAKPVGYNIYRRTEAADFPLHPVNPTPVSGSPFLDKEVQNGVRYFYEVRAVASDSPPWIESQAGDEAGAEPADRIPPAPPKGLEIIPGKEIVRLFWDENTEADLAGYRIYRKSGEDTDFVQVGDVKIPGTVFTDSDVRSGIVYEYYVTAYDEAVQSNESGPSRHVKTAW
ncbi:MAG: fibronectin type III domain-containing protein [bacterium]